MCGVEGGGEPSVTRPRAPTREVRPRPEQLMLRRWGPRQYDATDAFR